MRNFTEFSCVNQYKVLLSYKRKYTYILSSTRELNRVSIRKTLKISRVHSKKILR